MTPQVSKGYIPFIMLLSKAGVKIPSPRQSSTLKALANALFDLG